MADIPINTIYGEWLKRGQQKGYITILGNKIIYNALGYSDDITDPSAQKGGTSTDSPKPKRLQSDP